MIRSSLPVCFAVDACLPTPGVSGPAQAQSIEAVISDDADDLERFAVGYLDTIEWVKKAATAERASLDARQRGDQAAFMSKLAEAIELAKLAQTTAFRAIETFAGVARDRADCGAVATMAE